jgi:hypothetical protein
MNSCASDTIRVVHDCLAPCLPYVLLPFNSQNHVISICACGFFQLTPAPLTLVILKPACLPPPSLFYCIPCTLLACAPSCNGGNLDAHLVTHVGSIMPVVALYTSRHIAAGEELTWRYAGSAMQESLSGNAGKTRDEALPPQGSGASNGEVKSDGGKGGGAGTGVGTGRAAQIRVRRTCMCGSSTCKGYL